jgi:hypothetical protein
MHTILVCEEIYARGELNMAHMEQLTDYVLPIFVCRSILVEKLTG